MRDFLLYSLLFWMVGCNMTSRNIDVLQAEVKWFGKAAEKTSTTLLAEDKEAAAKGDKARCKALATDAIVVKTRGPWHQAMALYLSRTTAMPAPSVDPPAIPSVDTYCEVSK
jgi:hypothetical protein